MCVYCSCFSSHPQCCTLRSSIIRQRVRLSVVLKQRVPRLTSLMFENINAINPFIPHLPPGIRSKWLTLTTQREQPRTGSSWEKELLCGRPLNLTGWTGSLSDASSRVDENLSGVGSNARLVSDGKVLISVRCWTRSQLSTWTSPAGSFTTAYVDAFMEARWLTQTGDFHRPPTSLWGKQLGLSPKMSLIEPLAEALTDYCYWSKVHGPCSFDDASIFGESESIKGVAKITTASGSLKPPSATFRRCQADTKC